MSKKIFMGGICGMGMAPLALFLAEGGCQISGFDDSPNGLVLDMLKSRGIEIEKSRVPKSKVDGHA